MVSLLSITARFLFRYSAFIHFGCLHFDQQCMCRCLFCCSPSSHITPVQPLVTQAAQSCGVTQECEKHPGVRVHSWTLHHRLPSSSHVGPCRKRASSGEVTLGIRLTLILGTFCIFRKITRCLNFMYSILYIQTYRFNCNRVFLLKLVMSPYSTICSHRSCLNSHMTFLIPLTFFFDIFRVTLWIYVAVFVAYLEIIRCQLLFPCLFWVDCFG